MKKPISFLRLNLFRSKNERFEEKVVNSKKVTTVLQAKIEKLGKEKDELKTKIENLNKEIAKLHENNELLAKKNSLLSLLIKPITDLGFPDDSLKELFEQISIALKLQIENEARIRYEASYRDQGGRASSSI